VSFFELFLRLPGYHICPLFTVHCCQNKQTKKIVAYWFIFGFLASPADELWHLWKFFGKFILWA